VDRIRDIFGRPKALIGMVHVGALPGTPRASEPVDALADRASEEARLLVDAGFDGVLIENMHDAPYLIREDVGHEIVASMSAVGTAVRRAIEAPIGIQILAGANEAALAVAHATGLQFVRAEGFVFASVADEGLMATADAGRLLRYRRRIGADGIAIFADVRKKHSAHALTSDLSIGDIARNAEFFGAEALVVTGVSTGYAPAPGDLEKAREATALPVLVGSGAAPETMPELMARSDAVIVGSWFKRDGDWRNAPDADRVERLVDAARNARGA